MYRNFDWHHSIGDSCFFFDHEPRFTTSAIMVSGMNPIAAKNFQHYPPGSSRLRALKLAGRFTQTEVFFVLQTRSYCVETRDNKGMGVVVNSKPTNQRPLRKSEKIKDIAKTKIKYIMKCNIFFVFRNQMYIFISVVLFTAVLLLHTFQTARFPPWCSVQVVSPKYIASGCVNFFFYLFKATEVVSSLLWKLSKHSGLKYK